MTTSASPIDLAPFCLHGDEYRAYLSTPITDGVWTYATYGQIAIRIPGAHGRNATELVHQHTLPGLEKIFTDLRRWFAAADDPATVWHPFLPVAPAAPPRAVRCTVCTGRQKTVLCQSCDGDGEHQCEQRGCADIHECGACEGAGHVGASEADQAEQPDAITACAHCNASGREPDIRYIHLGSGLCVHARALHAVQSLPGPSEWRSAAPTSQPHPLRGWPADWFHGPILWRGPGWTAVIAPRIHPSGTTIEAPRPWPGPALPAEFLAWLAERERRYGPAAPAAAEAPAAPAPSADLTP